jgi:tetratricopeptide (TPR) repeat protein
MAQQPDLPGATTSYSDPFYDRLESVAQRIAKRLWLVLLALVVIVVVAVVTHAAMRDTPIAASAGRFIDAATKRMEAERLREPGERSAKLAEAEKAFVAVLADEAVTPYYRARAGIEITQLAVDRSALSEAKDAIAKAKGWAAKAVDPDLDLAVSLSEAAVQFQAGDFAAAETAYLNVERAAGLTHPDRQIAATIGAAQAMVAQNRIDEAIAKLEVLASRNDSNATFLLSVAKNQYWSLKRQKATPAAKPSVPEAAAPAPAAPAEAPVTTAPAAAVVPAPVPAPAAVVPAPAPGPEGK